ncbi:PREDICTED: NF-kappa-B inhibitor epsilon-like [Merops nubicus]|uniref:NF-kappa-B inhibitor epsilon-like n=1 Tax=Merops nubicus TaxID=57421 RepID=UPI0004F03444|nr:PREDICTED: NF-kappa-B inhibitor epsilon-like [Merops nubicus]
MAAPLAFLCAGGLRASPAVAVPKGKDVGGEQEIGAGQQIGWHGDCAVQVIPDWRWASVWLWLPAFVEGKEEVWCVAGSGEPEFPRRLPEPRPPSAATRRGPWALRNVSQALQACLGWKPGFGQCQVQALHVLLVHLAIIHCVPAVALCCIAQLPREVLEIQNDLFQTPLHLAVYLEQPSVIQALIHKGVNPGLQDRNGNTPLHLACEQQRLQCAQQLLQGTVLPEDTAQPHGHHQDLQLQNWQGLACLHISTLKGNIPMMSLLLKSGANIDVREGTSGKTPLHLAVESHNRRAVQFLLRNGAYVDAQMYNGCTPLHLAVGRKDAAIAAILSHSGADTLLRNMENETAQDLADGNDDLLALLPFDDLKISGKPVVCSE